MSAPAPTPSDAGGDSYANGNQGLAQEKRTRVKLSCNYCRHAKLKCDRGQPCSQYVKRDRPMLCAYLPAPVRKKPARKVQDRLHHLESLVKNLITEQTPPQISGNVQAGSLAQDIQSLNVNGSMDSPSVSLPAVDGARCPRTAKRYASGQVVLGANETTFVGATHWAAILDDIEQVKSYFDESDEDDVDGRSPEDDSHAGLIFGMGSNASKSDLITALPPKSIVDRLVSTYFRSNDPAMNIIHKPTFQNEYHEFWQDPAGKPVIWLGLLYSILCLATCFIIRAGDELPEAGASPNEIVNIYRQRCSQCLLLSNYTKPGLYTLETYLLNLQSEVIRYGLMQSRTWLVHGLGIRLALQMGLHRDAKHHPNISVFHGEMRRRVWHFLWQIDLLLSFHLGLPSMLRSIQTDTATPSNLLDEDFSEDSTELPPARPVSQPTEMSYILCKARIINLFGIVADQANSLIPPSYNEVMDVDKKLAEAYTRIPPHLRIRPLSQSITDSAHVIIQRYNIELLYHKSRCVLHRQVLIKRNNISHVSYLNATCMDSALELLRHQVSIDEAARPGGPLSRDKWYLTSLASHDFLLAAMIIYTSLSHPTKPVPSADRPHTAVEERWNMLQALETSYRIWTTWESDKARKAAQVLATMLKNLKRLNAVEMPVSLSSMGTKMPINGLQPVFGMNYDMWPHSSPSKEGFPSFTNTDTEPQLGNSAGQVPLPTSEGIEDVSSLFNMAADVDWSLWDHRFDKQAIPASNDSSPPDLPQNNLSDPGTHEMHTKRTPEGEELERLYLSQVYDYY